VLHCSTVKSLQFCSFWMKWHISWASISLPSFEYLKHHNTDMTVKCASHITVKLLVRLKYFKSLTDNNANFYEEHDSEGWDTIEKKKKKKRM
jgi:hypothetical protein